MPELKFAPLHDYLTRCGRAAIQLSFQEIEGIIGEKLCPSAHLYSAYWRPSPTHACGRAICNAGYRVERVNFKEEIICLVKTEG